MHPIYYIISERDYSNPVSQMYGLGRIIAVFECDLADIDAIYERHVVRLQHDNRWVQTTMFYREPPNPLAELAKQEKPGALPGD